MRVHLNITEAQQFVGHRNAITSLAISEDGKALLSGSMDRYPPRLWDVATGAETNRLGRTSLLGLRPVTAVGFARTSSKLVTATRDGTVQLWDQQTLHQVLQLKHRSPGMLLSPLTFGCFPAVFSPDGQRLITGSLDRTARIWDAETGDELLRIDTAPVGVTAVAFAPDGSTVLTGTIRGGVSLWDALTGEEIQRFQEPIGKPMAIVYSVEMSPDGRFVLAGSSWEYAQMWDVETGRELQRFGNKELMSVEAAIFSPDTKLIITGSFDNTVRVWDVETTSELACIDCRCGRRLPKGFTRVALSPQGDYLMASCADNIIRQYRFHKVPLADQ